MSYTHYDLGHQQQGKIVEVTLQGSAANVRLMNSSSFQSYRNRRNFKHYGGLARKSPIRLEIPSTGQWHIVIDMQGLGGRVKSSVRML